MTMRLPNDYVYLDWAATTPLCEHAQRAMDEYLRIGCSWKTLESNANPNSLHTPGRNAFATLEDTRHIVAQSVHAARPTEIVFTSGATEADNTAVLGIAAARARREYQKGNSSYIPHIVTSAIEHDAILSLVPFMRNLGWDVDIVKPDRQGRITVEALKSVLRPETAVASIMWANNEIGTLQDIPALAKAAHEAGAAFHTDATQAVGKVPVDFATSGIDAASFSSHKVCGPKGIGALYLKTGTPCDPLLRGGGQEGGIRSGTQNVLGALGFAEAVKWSVQDVEAVRKQLSKLRDYLYRELCSTGMARPSCAEAPGSDGFLPNIVNVLVPGFESETLILQLDLAGFAVSGGSACSSGSLEPSHVLTALGIPKDDALCSLRISLGWLTEEAELQRFVDAFKRIVGCR